MQVQADREFFTVSKTGQIRVGQLIDNDIDSILCEELNKQILQRETKSLIIREYEN